MSKQAVKMGAAASSPANSGTATAGQGNAMGSPMAKPAAAGTVAPGLRIGEIATEALELTPGMEELDESARVQAFLASPDTATQADAKAGAAAESDEDEAGDDDGETEDGEDAEEDSGTEDAEQDDAGADEDEGEEGEEAEDSGEEEEADPLDEALKDKPKLRKRVKKLFAQNKELKTKAQELEQQMSALKEAPLVLKQPSVSDPLAGTRSVAEVDAALNDADEKLDWLDDHPEGGEYNGQAYTAEQVKEFRKFYRAVVKAGPVRKDYLRSYAESLKGLGLDPVELVKPATPTRESALLQEIPELSRRADFLQVLADARAGRELREKKARGITVVEVDPKKSKQAAAKKPTEQAKKPAPAGGSQRPAREGEVSLERLRDRAAAGDPDAQQMLESMFLGG